jgi:hypothetical protein
MVDPSTPTRLAIISPEYGSNTTSSAHTIDYLSTPFNGTRIISGVGTSDDTADGSLGGTANNVNITKADRHFAVNTGTAAVGVANAAGLTVSALVSLQDSAGWQGISKAYLVPGNAAACNLANNVSTVNATPSNTVPLTVSSAAFNGSAAANLALCIEADGTASLLPRTIQANVDVNVTGTGANDPAA